MGYGRTTTLIKAVGTERNAFVHGGKVAVNPILVDELVDGFLDEHNAWANIHILCLKETREPVRQCRSEWPTGNAELRHGCRRRRCDVHGVRHPAPCAACWRWQCDQIIDYRADRGSFSVDGSLTSAIYIPTVGMEATWNETLGVRVMCPRFNVNWFCPLLEIDAAGASKCEIVMAVSHRSWILAKFSNESAAENSFLARYALR